MLAEQGIAHEWLSAGEAAQRWPGMVFEGRVLHQPDRSGRVHAEHAVAALTAAAVGHGALVRHRARVTRVAVRGEHQVDVLTEQDVVRARRVVVAAGAWTQSLVGGLVPLPPLRVVQERAASFPVLGALPCGVCPKDWPAFVHHAATDTYGLPSPGEGVVVGAAARADLARLRDHVRRWLPGADAERPNPIAWTATYTPDARFVLDRCGPVVVGTGSAAHGFTFAPTFGRALADLAVGARIPAAS
jgi:sarcosine oxidase